MIFLALRHLFARKKQTLFTLSGIFLGTLSFIVISALMLGFRENLLNELVQNDAHIHINARDELLQEHSLDSYFNKIPSSHIVWRSPPSGRLNNEAVHNPEKWIHILQSEPRVSAFSPQCSSDAILQYGRGQVSTQITGCIPKQEQHMTKAAAHVTEGRFEDIALGTHYLAIGSLLQKHLGVRLYQTVLVSTGNGSKIPFKIVAIFKTNSPFVDYKSFSSLEAVQELKNAPHQISKIAVKLHDHTQASALATSWLSFGKEKIESWDQLYSSIFQMFLIQDAIRFFCIGAVLVVAGFGIYNILNMTVMQKRKDVAILRSMGYSTKAILSLFFSQGIILGLSGTALGVCFGYLLGMLLGTITLGGGGLSLEPEQLPISTSLSIYLQAIALGLFSSSLASFLPARLAAKLSPIEIIRAGAE
ncbi:MAG: ABC transporter permease [Simkaniaceae bacterium]|nr:MAG: ABC transporter permease [Simkaniaceae bacterium]